jgi:hypothetical protein
MALDTSLSRSGKDAVSIEKQGPGIRTRVLFLTSLMLIIAGTTASSLYIIRSELGRGVQANLQMDLAQSVETFQDLESDHRAALERENALMAAEPRLKALMTTNDSRTIADDALEFWKTSGDDLFALADAEHRVQAAYAQDMSNTDGLRRDLQVVITDASKHYLSPSRYQSRAAYGDLVKPFTKLSSACNSRNLCSTAEGQDVHTASPGCTSGKQRSIT